MKTCPVDKSCISFDTIEESEAHFKLLAGDEELTDNTCVEGNSGLKYRTVKKAG